MTFLNMMASFQAAYVKAAQRGGVTGEAQRGEKSIQDTQESGALLSSTEAALPLELKLMIIRNRIKNN